ncbi:hypothetical protein [Aeromonas hydrophila]|uniref:hypothetical protein n=1 Tax=Aeromonas hydrophila TaxID=644 RepID=UPI0023656D7F|nr:hypothetical protein [Aeromonas hydrophila]WDF91736.1 hypothetical protein PUB83_05570 [Aeromonas hydrophila subsp. hydrophila]
MTNETALLALLESQEAEVNAKAEWIAEWSEENLPLLLAGQLETDAATLLAEVNAERATQLNQAIYLLMVSGDKVPLTLQIQQVLNAGLDALAQEAWSNHLAALHDAMSDELWEQYQFNHQRTAA